MIEVAPGAEFETSVDWGVTGLAGTLRVSVVDGVGGTAVAATTSGIVETPAGSKQYTATCIAPGTGGQYRTVFDDQNGEYAIGDDILVTGATASVGGAGQLYVTRAELKLELNITVATYDDWKIQCETIRIPKAAAKTAETSFPATSQTARARLRVILGTLSPLESSIIFILSAPGIRTR